MASAELDNPPRDLSDQRPSLTLLLKKAMYQCPYDVNTTFLPDNEIGRVMTSEYVEDFLISSGQEVLRANCSQITKHVCGQPGSSNLHGTSRRIFAILLIVEEPTKILDIIREGIDDTALPIRRVDSDEECLLARKTSSKPILIPSLCAWPLALRYAFYHNQWRVQAPVFLKGGSSLENHPIHRLDSDIVFPWTDYEKKYDGNSEVVRVKIHEAHCQFDADENRPLALKSHKPIKSATLDKDFEFRLEVEANLKVKRRRHLEAGLLTTFEYRERYHMLFRWADGGSLNDLWRKRHPRPEVTYKWICWLAQQCEGLAYGLGGIHDTRMTAEDLQAIRSSPISSTSAQIATEPSPRTLAGDDDGRYYGRHGDIKPQNILWFEKDSNSFGLGDLKLSDLGLTTFQQAPTMEVSSKGVRVVPTYSAPEREISGTLSQAFDIWSLGCIFLEFVTWILVGAEGLDEFGDQRHKDGGSRDSRFNVDNFFLVIKEEEQIRAQVKPSVSNWIVHLKNMRDCSPFLSDVLGYIQTNMLLVDKEKRDNSDAVSKRLKGLFEKCQQNPGYALYRDAKELDEIIARASLATT
ncbi:Cyclin-dependent kinase E-1 [Cytospora mali]|uniref:Cyclin-dependent kinase E-1 n=1 Tax=Cytospora mali TaxID=578113 RepID=A0A194W9T0_CYTMA|nr:Cyclin-dependent kinase E-1 [Valsa mali]